MASPRPPGYEAFLTSNAPTWLQRPNGQAWLAAHGELLDELLDRTIAAVKARFPTGGTPSDGLGYLGDERGLPRGPQDTDDTYAATLQAAWDLWPQCGSPKGLLRALWRAGYQNVVLVQCTGRAFTLPAYDADVVIRQLPGTPPWWSVDLNHAFWSRFQLIFPAPLPASWTNVQPNPDATTHPALDEVNALRRLCRKWKGATRTLVSIVVITSGELWGWPLGTWGDPGVWGGTTVQWGPQET